MWKNLPVWNHKAYSIDIWYVASTKFVRIIGLEPKMAPPLGLIVLHMLI